MALIGIFNRSFQRGLFVTFNLILAEKVLKWETYSRDRLVSTISYIVLSSELGRLISSTLTGVIADVFPKSRLYVYGICLVLLCISNGLLTYVTSLEYTLLVLFARGMFDVSVFIMAQTISGTYTAVKPLDSNKIDDFYSQIHRNFFVKRTIQTQNGSKLICKKC